MSAFADRLERIDVEAEKRANWFQNLEPETLSAFIDFMVYQYHMTNRELGAIPVSGDLLANVIRFKMRMAVYEELGTLASEMMQAKRKPEPGINGPEEEE